MLAGQWLEREGRFSCSTKKKLSVADAQVVRIVDRATTWLVSISVHKHIDANSETVSERVYLVYLDVQTLTWAGAEHNVRNV